MTAWQKGLVIILAFTSMSAVLLLLEQQVAYSTATVAVNATHEIDMMESSLSSEEMLKLIDAEYAARNETHRIFDYLQTSEGINAFDDICNYVSENNPYKVIDCYEKNKDRIK